MKSLGDYINSGILELFVLGLASAEECAEVEKMSAIHPEIEKEISEIAKALMVYSESNTPEIDPTLKSMIMATIDYTERLKNGEPQTFPPILNEHSSVSDYANWLNRKDMVLTDELKDFEVKLIGHELKAMTAIVWIKEETPYEIHSDVYEKFLIIEGSCNIITDKGTHSLMPGDYFSLPLDLGHIVKVTSKQPCKVILQRVAA